jgi:hypothetical protein
MPRDSAKLTSQQGQSDGSSDVSSEERMAWERVILSILYTSEASELGMKADDKDKSINKNKGRGWA